MERRVAIVNDASTQLPSPSRTRPGWQAMLPDDHEGPGTIAVDILQ